MYRSFKMSIYESKSCPVCNKKFEKDDDIVVCPECGTPHHRECYNLIGHCVNKGLHASNYNYYEDSNKSEVKEEVSSEYYSPKNEEESQEEKSFPQSPFATVIENEYDNSREKIDDEDIADIAAVVRINQKRFIDKFKKIEETNKKAGWNWSGFFFGSFYLLYRKMYRIGIGFFSVIVALIFASSALMYKLAPEFVKMTADLSELVRQGATPTNEQLEAVMSCGDAQNAVMICYGLLGIVFIIHIIIGIFADSFYKSTVLGIIKSFKEQFADGFSIGQPTIIMGGDMNMTEEQLKKLYLSKKGGTSFIAPALALLFISILI